jgi:hypothetical protein
MAKWSGFSKAAALRWKVIWSTFNFGEANA